MDTGNESVEAGGRVTRLGRLVAGVGWSEARLAGSELNICCVCSWVSWVRGEGK